MHIVLVSACQKRAIKRTRKVLDRYAVRTSQQSWATPITLEGLQSIRAQLRQVATRQTAVACYKNEGRNRLKLIWIVGSRSAFGPAGHFPSGTKQVQRMQTPKWVAQASLLAQIGGLAHDLGKAGAIFAEKLAKSAAEEKTEPDNICHEWLSMKVIQGLRMELSWKQIWQDLQKERVQQELGSLKQGINSIESALDYLVVTHHKLLGPRTEIAIPNHGQHIRQFDRKLTVAGEITEEIIKRLESLTEQLKKQTNEKPADYWRGLAIISRAALILADHRASAIKKGPILPSQADSTALYANTCVEEKEGKKEKGYNQTLPWHLKKVSGYADDNAYNLGTLRLPGLSQETVDFILAPTEMEKYQWQNRVVEVLQNNRKISDTPALIFNIAATGSGKTWMNVKTACALRAIRPRFAIALNLRTLTLQTGDSLKKDMKIGADELATVIGDRVAQQLHEYGKTAADVQVDESNGSHDENSVFDVMGGEVELPKWMSSITEKRPEWGKIISVPALVSTIDFLVKAGEPGAQGNHAAAVIRLADSDLILDEIDSYDPQAMVAVLRLIQTAALLGRHVICSSATLSVPIANAIYEVFTSGVKMCSALEQNEEVKEQASAADIFIFDDKIKPSASPLFNTTDEFEEYYNRHVDSMLSGALPCYRKPYLQQISDETEEGWKTAVLTAVNKLHQSNTWKLKQADKKSVSFGLVRVANIKTAIMVARYLADTLPYAKIACYHSQEFVIQRYKKEQRLDYLLSRKNESKNIKNDEEIKKLMAQSKAQSIPFIVVATPVEEIGRDHDFDWAVIEPSSTHSIVQTAGRVNRHRLDLVSEPNVAILQYNWRYIISKPDEPIFCRPGLETAKEYSYQSHDLAELLNWNYLDAINAKLRFGAHPFAKKDDEIWRKQLKEPLHIIKADPAWASVWMTQGFYHKYPLRTKDDQQKSDWKCVVGDDATEEVFYRLEFTDSKMQWIGPKNCKSDKNHERVANDRLVYTAQELKGFCEEAEINVEKGFTVSIFENSGSLIYDRSFGFSGS